MTKELYNTDYEKIILSMLLIDNSLIDVISGRLQKDCFFNLKLRQIYSEILNLWNTDRHVDFMNLSEKLPSIPISELVELTEINATTANWEFYVNKIKTLFLTRQVKTELAEKIDKKKIIAI